MRVGKDHGLLLARIGIGLVFILFGIGKLQGDVWAETMRQHPVMHMVPMPVDYQIYGIGLVEIIIGLCLLAGIYVRAVAMLAIAQLFVIFFIMGIHEIRDIGLIGAL